MAGTFVDDSSVAIGIIEDYVHSLIKRGERWSLVLLNFYLDREGLQEFRGGFAKQFAKRALEKLLNTGLLPPKEEIFSIQRLLEEMQDEKDNAKRERRRARKVTQNNNYSGSHFDGCSIEKLNHNMHGFGSAQNVVSSPHKSGSLADQVPRPNRAETAGTQQRRDDFVGPFSSPARTPLMERRFNVPFPQSERHDLMLTGIATHSLVQQIASENLRVEQQVKDNDPFQQPDHELCFKQSPPLQQLYLERGIPRLQTNPLFQLERVVGRGTNETGEKRRRTGFEFKGRSGRNPGEEAVAEGLHFDRMSPSYKRKGPLSRLASSPSGSAPRSPRRLLRAADGRAYADGDASEDTRPLRSLSTTRLMDSLTLNSPFQEEERSVARDAELCRGAQQSVRANINLHQQDPETVEGDAAGRALDPPIRRRFTEAARETSYLPERTPDSSPIDSGGTKRESAHLFALDSPSQGYRALKADAANGLLSSVMQRNGIDANSQETIAAGQDSPAKARSYRATMEAAHVDSVQTSPLKRQAHRSSSAVENGDRSPPTADVTGGITRIFAASENAVDISVSKLRTEEVDNGKASVDPRTLIATFLASASPVKDLDTRPQPSQSPNPTGAHGLPPPPSPSTTGRSLLPRCPAFPPPGDSPSAATSTQGAGERPPPEIAAGPSREQVGPKQQAGLDPRRLLSGTRPPSRLKPPAPPIKLPPPLRPPAKARSSSSFPRATAAIRVPGFSMGKTKTLPSGGRGKGDGAAGGPVVRGQSTPVEGPSEDVVNGETVAASMDKGVIYNDPRQEERAARQAGETLSTTVKEGTQMPECRASPLNAISESRSATLLDWSDDAPGLLEEDDFTW